MLKTCSHEICKPLKVNMTFTDHASHREVQTQCLTCMLPDIAKAPDSGVPVSLHMELHLVP